MSSSDSRLHPGEEGRKDVQRETGMEKLGWRQMEGLEEFGGSEGTQLSGQASL